MGVTATFCMVCGLPVQHDHYVATERENCWAIYRSDNRPPGHFPFQPDHHWLVNAIAIADGEFHLGVCEDGVVSADDGETYFVGDSYEEAGCLHAYCWHAAGRPTGYEQAYHYASAFERTFASKYQEQLFEFGLCVSDGNGWMLVNPATPQGAQCKARIDAILKTPKLTESEPANVAELLASDSWAYWRRAYEGGVDFWRYRTNVSKEIDKGDYPHLFWVVLDRAEIPIAKMEQFERDLYARLQEPGHAVALATLTAAGKYYMALYAKDPDASQAILDELCPVKDFEVERDSDPEWTAYYEELHSQLVHARGY